MNAQTTSSLAVSQTTDTANQPLRVAELTTQTTTAPRPTGRDRDRTGPSTGYNPDWFVAAVRSDDFQETSSRQVKTLDYRQAEAEASPMSRVVHGLQPAGSLTGKVVFTMAGHGWTYDDEDMTWFTQRGLNLGMVEDFGNLDQMHIFAHYAWHAGATVVPLRPVDHQLNERILDNSSPQTRLFGPWVASASSIYHGSKYDKDPYVFTTATLTETAIARFRPFIPESGEYPVYTWVCDGRDRVNQCYRVVHAGGVVDIRVDHRRIGKGWVWLGTFYFEKGDGGHVDISNAVCDPYEANGRNVIVADGMRFGNGYSDVRRPAGISGFPREDEGDVYWIERSLGPTADPRIYSMRSDASATVSAPPKTAAYMNRESDGRYYDRVLLSFHSNALAGKSRGAVGLFNESPGQRPDYQEKFAELLGRTLNDEMVAAPSISDVQWAPRARVTYNGINFGELRRDYVQNEMVASIVEVAFHDNPDDVRFLLDPASRMDMARGCLRAMLKWFASVSFGNQAVAMLPTPPREVAVRVQGSTVTLSWVPGPSSSIVGDPPTDYRVYLSRDGRSFDAGHQSDGATAMELRLDAGRILAPDDFLSTPPTSFASQTSTTAIFARVAAINPGGQSFPSETVAFVPADSGGTSRTLVVVTPSRLDASSNIPQQKGLGLSYPTPPFGTAGRVRPLATRLPHTLIAVADALTSSGKMFDTCCATVLQSGRMNLADYGTVIWLSGATDASELLASPGLQSQMLSFVSGGGNLLLTGSGIAPALAGSAGQTTSALRQIFGATNVMTVQDPSGLVASALPETTAIREPLVMSPRFDSFTAERGAGAKLWLSYQPMNLPAAVVRRIPNGGVAALIGVPFEAMESPLFRRFVIERFYEGFAN